MKIAFGPAFVLGADHPPHVTDMGFSVQVKRDIVKMGRCVFPSIRRSLVRRIVMVACKNAFQVLGVDAGIKLDKSGFVRTHGIVFLIQRFL